MDRKAAQHIRDAKAKSRHPQHLQQEVLRLQDIMLAMHYSGEAIDFGLWHVVSRRVRHIQLVAWSRGWRQLLHVCNDTADGLNYLREQHHDTQWQSQADAVQREAQIFS